MTRNFGGNLREGREVARSQHWQRVLISGNCNLPAHRLGIEASLQRGVLASSILVGVWVWFSSIFEALYHLT